MPTTRNILLFVILLSVFAVGTRTAWDQFLKRAGLGAFCLEQLPPSSNDMANYDSIQALVEKHTWNIDESMFGTADKVKVGEHYYSVRPPVLAFLTSGVYWVLYHWCSVSFGTYPNLVSWILTVTVCGALSSLACVSMSACVQKINASTQRPGRSVASPVAAAVSLGIASLILPYSVVFNHHIVAAALDMFAIWLLLRSQFEGEFSKVSAYSVGLFAALGAAVDPAGGGIFLFGLLGWLLSVPILRRRCHIAMVGVVMAAALHGLLNWSITGDLKPLLLRADLIQQSAPSLRPDEISGFLNHKDLASLGNYVFGMLVGNGPNPRGLFLYSPCVLFGWLCSWRIVRTPGHPFRCGAFWLLLASIGLVGYLCLFTNNYSGTNYGIRWFVLLLPPAYLALFAGWRLLSFWQRCAAIACQLWSLMIAWIGVFRFTWQDWDVMPYLSEIRWVVLGILIVALLLRRENSESGPLFSSTKL